MNLYYIHDDPTNYCLSGEYPWYVLIWAETARDALLIAVALYDGDAPRTVAYAAMFSVEALPLTPTIVAPPWPGREDRLDVLRLCGFSCEGECRCALCGLAPMGLIEYALCQECDCCFACGHTADCPRYPNSERTSL